MGNSVHCELAVRVTPRSSRNRIELFGVQIRVWVSASPTDGQANAAVCKIITEKLRVGQTSVTVLRGMSSREKTLRVVGLDLQSALAKLNE
jgi:uncharacterized protein YggU (UPF0235/DUF167 family)